MPQMAPTMWLPLFILIISLLILMKSSIYFIFNKTMTEVNNKKICFNNNWVW